MEHAPCISQIATLLADPKRSAMMWALMDGTARQADELALLAGLSPSSANAHLGRLSTGGLLKVEIRGRKRFFRLAAPEIGAAVEALASATLASTPRQIPDVFKRGLMPTKAPTAPASLMRARLCDDHLGGTLAADLYQRLLDAGWLEQLEQRVIVSHKGANQLAGHGLFIQALAHRNARIACPCPDWSERRPHLGGALGAALLQLFMQSGWLSLPNDSRALQVTTLGQQEIHRFARQDTLEMAL
ncbi:MULTISPECIES: ArsR/SmtB family transcription factor [Pseudomonas]|jgi:DNA-binding transcriptional ArsR family regulator|uniref:ArsR family transcriptional regulator n=1 Tax=Pseudomonas frederiksbergensis TaxID=104087 RepID=A0A0B1YVR7_9PSED|nr:MULTISPECIES: helix-turn-helix transcriptional regulator [Pseudomonas]KHK62480.1 ArsR family transcriptional regulator [Pseudomonas frederiksbergensis]KJH88051.1 ArsR family transcriptional regulator [Pseudomonas fluorescens]MBI6617545.1 helix-turn-helix transcriptional regulator [Pseudomonas corrugata]MBI6692136.1 helix-turn-helix transcriptional regulator [Pseudomonas corrugata]WRV69137.1 helix-turn-helix transcriptional regulator [Pseudomonas frederiksbergensis]